MEAPAARPDEGIAREQMGVRIIVRTEQSGVKENEGGSQGDVLARAIGLGCRPTSRLAGRERGATVARSGRG